MISWLKSLSPPLRYSVYVACVILGFFAAVGVGATAAVMADWQLRRVGTGSTETGTLEGSGLETTGSADGLEATGIEPSGDSNDSNGTDPRASFVHRADRENSRGDYTYISDPNIDGDADAIVLASPASEPGTYGRNIGVWYEPAARQWAIFNQDRAPVAAGSAFRVVVPQASAGFVHQASLLNTARDYTYLDNRLTNGRPDAVLTVTQNWNPGGGRGVYNDHQIATLYDETIKKWAIYNRDGAPIPEGAAFNVAVSAGSGRTAR